jgi:hypothetical protein
MNMKQEKERKLALINAIRKGLVRIEEVKQGAVIFLKQPRGSYQRKVGGAKYTPKQMEEFRRSFPLFMELSLENEVRFCWFSFEELMMKASVI